MHRAFLKNSQIYLRAVLFFGVFAALLFSCGEGIRLFPFPASAAAASEKSILENTGKSGYQKNVLRFEKGEGNGFAKIKRAAKDFPAGVFAAPMKIPLFQARALRKIDFSLRQRIIKTLGVRLALNSRAPPFS